MLVQAESVKIKIIGHTDNTGNPDANLNLSNGRANAVAQYLKDKGIPSERFQTVEGAGDTQPIADNSTAANKSKNRRVEIALLK